MDTNCKHCHKLIKVRPCRLKKAKYGWSYCSKLCQHKATYQKVTCLICGKIFEAPQSGNRKYCSMVCRNKRIPWNKGKPWGEKIRAKISASSPDRRGKKNPHYDHNKPIRQCRICKREFRPAKSQIEGGYGIYCSHSCYLKNKGETDIEKIIHKQLNKIGEFYFSQHKIGYWTVDFYLPLRSLIIEADGSFWHATPEAKRRDKAKNTYLTRRRYKILRLGDKTIKARNFMISHFLNTCTNQ